MTITQQGKGQSLGKTVLRQVGKDRLIRNQPPPRAQSKTWYGASEMWDHHLAVIASPRRGRGDPALGLRRSRWSLGITAVGV
jgi:hypothetical protein